MTHEGKSAEAAFNTQLPDGFPKQIIVDIEPDADKLHDECGVVGIWAPGQDVIHKTVIGMEGLQHRGHSGAGIAYVDENAPVTQDGTLHPLVIHKGHGRVSQAIRDIYRPEEESWEADLELLDMVVGATVAIGHTRYSTAEREDSIALHPMQIGHTDSQQAGTSNRAFAHNGQMDNIDEVAAKHGMDVSDKASDTHGLAMILSAKTQQGEGVVGAMHDVLPDVNGAYCLTILDGKQLHAARDPWGFHPIAIGVLPGGKGFVVASESVVFAEMGAEFLRDIEPGEIVTIDETGIKSSFIDRQEAPRLCAYEGIYTADENGIVDGRSVKRWRYALGYKLGEDQPAEAEILVPVPATSIPSAQGYSDATGIPLVNAITKVPGSPRTFQLRGDLRQAAIKGKYVIDSQQVYGKRVVLEDDSYIKGHTHDALVRGVIAAGAVSVDLRLSAPQYRWSCLQGMDTHIRGNLPASYLTDAEIATKHMARSVAFNTPARVQEAANEAYVVPRSSDRVGQLCMSCYTGEYPFPVPNSVPQSISLGMPAVRASVITSESSY